MSDIWLVYGIRYEVFVQAETSEEAIRKAKDVVPMGPVAPLVFPAKWVKDVLLSSDTPTCWNVAGRERRQLPTYGDLS